MSLISKLTTLGASGAGGDAYFYSALYTTSSSLTFNHQDRDGLAVNSSNVIAANCQLSSSGNQASHVWGLNPDGTTKFQIELDETTSNTDTEPTAIQSIGTDFYVTTVEKTTSGIDNCNLCKISDTGSLTWQATEGGSSQGGRHVPVGSATDGSQIVQVGNTRNDGSASNDFGFANSFDTSGSRNWIRLFEYNSQGWEARACTFDSSGDLYIGSHGYGIDGGNNVTGEANISITKYTSGGAVIAQYTFGDQYGDFVRSMATDSSNNVFILHRTQGLSLTAGTYITKVNSSLTPQWHRFAQYDSSYLIDLTVDSNGDIIAVGSGLSPKRASIFKFSGSTGALIFSRYFYHSGGSGELYPYNITLDNNDDIVVSGQGYNFGYASYRWVLKVRNDGSGTGTYGDFTYVDASKSSNSTVSFQTSNNRYSNKSTANITTGVGATMTSSTTSFGGITPVDLT